MKMIIEISEEDFLACKHWVNEGVANTTEDIIANGKPYEERPVGHWIKDCDNCDCSNCYDSTRKDCSGRCSNCGELQCCTDNFCPTCGANMRDKRGNNEIRWTDKLSVKNNGDIINFEGQVVGHINLEDMGGK